MIKDFLNKMATKKITPMFAWLKLYVFLILPSLMYFFGWWSFILVTIILILVFVFLPEKWVPKDNSGFMYHAMRGISLEFSENVVFVTPCFRTLFDQQWKKIVAWVLCVIYTFFILALIASKQLVLGSILYYPIILVIFRVMVEYKDVSEQQIIDDYIIPEDGEEDEDMRL